MADLLTRMRLDSSEYDQKVKRAAQNLLNFEAQCRATGQSMNTLSKENLDYVKSLGNMQTVSKNARGQISELSSAFIDLSMQYKRLSDEEKKGDVGRALSASLEQIKTRAIEAKRELSSLESQVSGMENMGKGGGGLSNLLGGIAGKFGMSASTFTGIGAAVTAAGAAFKLAGDNIRTAMNFEKSMSVLSSLTGMVGKDLDQLKEYAIELGGTTTLSASQVADAFRLIGSQQPQLLASGEALKEVTKYAITLSEAAGIDLSTAAQTLSTSINQMGGDSNNAARYVNVLAAASQKGAGDIAWLGEAITKSATAAKAVGTDYEELVANLEQLAKAGFDASTAGTALRSIIMNLEKQANQDYKPSIVGLTKAFENLRDAHLDITGYQQIAGKMFATQAMALANAASEARNMTEAITGTNTATEQAATNTANLDGSLKSLSSAWEALNLHINSSNGLLKVGVDGLASIVREADAAYKEFDRLTGGAGKLAGVLGSTLDVALEGIRAKLALITGAISLVNGLVGNTPPKQTASSGSTDVTHGNALAQSIIDRSSYYGEGPTAPTSPSTVVKVDADTDPAKKKISELKEEIKKLQKLKIEAADIGDDDAVDEYNQKIKALQAEIKSRLGNNTTTHKLTDPEKAQQVVDNAAASYAQTIKEADLRMQAGLDDSLAHKKKELQAQEQLFNAYGRAIAIYDDPKLRTAYNEAAARYQALAAEVKQQTEASEAQKKATRELEAAQKKLAAAQREMDAAEQRGDRRAYIAAEKKVTTARAEVERIKNEQTIIVNAVPGTVNLPDIPEEVEQTVTFKADDSDVLSKVQDIEGVTIDPKTLTVTANTQEAIDAINQIEGMTIQPKAVTFKASTDNLNAEVQHLKSKLGSLDVGTVEYNLTMGTLVDAKSFQALLNAEIKNGLKIDPELSQSLMSQIINAQDIPDSTWEDLQTSINEKLKEMGIDPIKIDFRTGDAAKIGKDTAKAWQSAASAVNSVGSALSGLEDPSAKIAGIVGQAVANIALGFAQATASKATGAAGVWGWIAAVTGGLATMVSTIASIKSATAGSYAEGGIVPGTSYSGDRLTAQVNSGELILNRSQQSNLAAQLSVPSPGESATPRIMLTGDKLFVAINNYLKATNKGQLVTSK